MNEVSVTVNVWVKRPSFKLSIERVFMALFNFQKIQLKATILNTGDIYTGDIYW